MFGRRRRNDPVPVPAAAAAELSPEQVFDLINSRLADLIGEHGAWTMVRRTDADTDRIFHAMLAHQIAAELTTAVIAEQAAVRGEEAPEPAALAWMPEPIAVWREHDLPLAIEEPALVEMLDTTDTDENEIVPARHAA